jgi:hypothetical protein
MGRVARLCLFLAPMLWPPWACGWQEQQVLEYIGAYNPVLRMQRTVTEAFAPPAGWLERAKEYASAYGRAGAGGNDYQTSGLVLQAGVQIAIPLASTKERREHAQKMVEETRAIEELQAKALADMGALRQQEADLAATETKLKFYADKSGWLQKRVKDGFSDADELWTIGQKLTEERAAAERLRTLAASQRYRLASYAGERWRELLSYLEGKGDLR